MANAKTANYAKVLMLECLLTFRTIPRQWTPLRVVTNPTYAFLYGRPEHDFSTTTSTASVSGYGGQRGGDRRLVQPATTVCLGHARNGTLLVSICERVGLNAVKYYPSNPKFRKSLAIPPRSGARDRPYRAASNDHGRSRASSRAVFQLDSRIDNMPSVQTKKLPVQ